MGVRRVFVTLFGFLQLSGVVGQGDWTTSFPPWGESGTPTSGAPVVKIPIILPVTTHSCGPTRYMMMRLATSHINRRDATFCPAIANLKNIFEIQYDVQDTGGSGTGGLQAVILLQGKMVVKVVLGPNSSGESQATSSYLSVFNVPQVSWAATASQLSNKVTYPNFYRTCSPNSLVVHVLAKFIQFLGYKKCNMAYFDSALTWDQKNEMTIAAQEIGLSVATFQIPSSGDNGVPVSAANMPLMMAVLAQLRMSTCRVNVVFSLNEEAWNFFSAANSLGMMNSQGFAWFGPQSLAGTQVAGKVERVPIFNGTIYIQAAGFGPTWPAMVAKWAALMPSTDTPEFNQYQWCRNESAGGARTVCNRLPTSVFSGWIPGTHDKQLVCQSFEAQAYDSMVTLALVLDRLLTSKNTTNPAALTAKDWSAEMLRLSQPANAFNCLSGFVSFNAQQERDMPMEFYNWKTERGLNAELVARWTGVAGFKWVPGVTVYWSGGDAGIADATGATLSFLPRGAPLPCPIGFIFNVSSGYCVACPAGQYMPQISGSELVTSCAVCPGGTFTNESGAADCHLCPSGSVSVPSRMYCDKCPPGTISASAGLASCTACDSGSFTRATASTECVFCPRGTFAAVAASPDCQVCPAGFTTENIASRSAAQCVCSEGSYLQGSSCVACPQGASTDSVGSANISQCLCPEGMYRPASNSACQACPTGMDCPRGSAEDNRYLLGQARSGTAEAFPVLKPLYWASLDEPLSVFECRWVEKCPGGDSGFSCPPHLSGQACEHCDVGFHWDGSRCAECASAEASRFMFPVLPLILGPICILLFYKVSGDPLAKWGSWQNCCACILFIVLKHYQMIDIMRSANVKMPRVVKSIFEGWTWVNNVASIFRVECVGYNNLQGKMVTYAVAPLVIAGLFFLTWAASRAAAALIRCLVVPPLDPHRLFNNFGSVLFTFFSEIAAISMLLFKCVGNPNGKATLSVDAAVICWESQPWRSMLGLGIACVLVYCFFMGGVFVRAMVIAPRGRNFQDYGFQMRWKFLFIKFRPDAYWWGVCIMAKDVLMNLGLVVFTLGVAQLYWLMTVIFAYTCMFIIHMPFRHRVSNAVELVASLSLIYCASLLMWFAPDLEGIDDEISLVTSVISFTPLLIGFLCAVHIALAAKFPFLNFWAPPPVEGRVVKLQEAAKAIAALDPNDAAMLLAGLSEWDRYYLYCVTQLVHSELLNARDGSRVTSSSLSALSGSRGSDVDPAKEGARKLAQALVSV